MQRLLNETRDPTHVKAYHLYYENATEFWKTAKRMFYQFDNSTPLKKVFSHQECFATKAKRANFKISVGKMDFRIDR